MKIDKERPKISNDQIIGGVFLCAAVATFHGAAHAADRAGVDWPINLLYPLMLDGLAIAALRKLIARERTAFAWFVMVLTATGSGWAQAYVLAAGKHGGAAYLAAGMGATPAAIVLLATVLRSAPRSTTSAHPDAHLVDTQTGAPEPATPTLPPPPPAGASAAPVRPDTLPQMHPRVHPGVQGQERIQVHAESAILDALAFDMALAGGDRLPARMPNGGAPASAPRSAPRVHLASAPEPPAVAPPARTPSAPRVRTPSAPQKRIRSAPAGTRRSASASAPRSAPERTDQQLADALRDAPEVRSLRAVAAHLNIGQERARRVLSKLQEDQ